MLSEYRNPKRGQTRAAMVAVVIALVCIVASIVLLFVFPLVGIVWLVASIGIALATWRRMSEMSDDNHLTFDGSVITVKVGNDSMQVHISDMNRFSYDEESGEMFIGSKDGRSSMFSRSSIFPSIDEAKRFEKDVLSVWRRS